MEDKTFSRINILRVAIENFTRIICVSFAYSPDRNRRSDKPFQTSPFGKTKNLHPSVKLDRDNGRGNKDGSCKLGTQQAHGAVMAHCSMMYRHVLKLSTVIKAERKRVGPGDGGDRKSFFFDPWTDSSTDRKLNTVTF